MTWKWWPDLTLLAIFAWLTIVTGLALVVNREFLVNDVVYIVVWLILGVALLATGALRRRG